MQTSTNICVMIKPRFDSHELYKRLKPYNVSVTDLGDRVYVYTRMLLHEKELIKILEICNEYGDCRVDARMVKSPS